MKGALVVFAKQPAPGCVKTRLCPPFSAQQAADFYAALLDDVLETSAQAAQELGLEATVRVTPGAAVDAFSARAPASMSVRAQRGADLSARMEHAAARAFAAGLAPVLLRGSDSPALGVETLRAALHKLESCDVALCPDLDGGYNLVGLAGPAPGLFDHPMSTASVLEDTRARAQARGLTVELLPAGFDIDRASDLEHLRAWPEAREKAPRAWAYLEQHALWPAT